MTRQLNGITVDTRLGDETARDNNMYVLALLTAHSAVAPANAPPGSPVADRLYIVGTAGTGAFAGHNNELAYFKNGVWNFFTPQAGMKMDALTWGGVSWA